MLPSSDHTKNSKHYHINHRHQTELITVPNTSRKNPNRKVFRKMLSEDFKESVNL